MFISPVALLFVCTMNSFLMATPFKDCGSKAGTIQSFDVSNCTVAPCKFIKGHNYTMNITMKAKAPSKSATVRLYAIIGGVLIPFPMPEVSVCKMGTKCPILTNDVNNVSMKLASLQSNLPLSLYLKLELIADDQQENYVSPISSDDH